MTGYNWLRDGLIPGAGAFLETLWLYAWITFGPEFIDLFDRGANLHSPGWALPWIWLLIAAPALAGRWLEVRFPRRFRVRQWALAGLILVIFAGFIKTQGVPARSLFDWRFLVDVIFPWVNVEPAKQLGVLGFTWFVGLVLIIRGVWLASSDYEQEGATRSFLIGLGAFLVLLAIMVAWTWGPGVEAALAALLFVYFCGGLMWLGLIKQQEIEERVYGRSLPRLRWSWLALFGSISLVFFAIGGIVAAIQGRLLGGASHVAQGSAPAAQELWNLLGAIQTGMTHFFIAILTFIFRLMPDSWLRAFLEADQSQTADNSQPNLPGGPQLPLPPHIQEVGLSIALLVALWYLIRRVRVYWLASGDETDEQTSLWSWDLLKSQLGGLRLRRRRRSKPRTVGRRRRGSQASEARERHAIRELYATVLRWCHERNLAREQSTTPGEFAPDLGRLVPPELATELTSAYEQVRYAEQAIDPGLPERLQAGLQLTRGRPARR